MDPRTGFQAVICKILENHGFQSPSEFGTDDHLKLEVPHLMPLTIARPKEDRLRVSHIKTRNGDLLTDPLVGFDTSEEPWLPIEFEQLPVVYEFDEDGLDLDDFLELWGSNIVKQGFVEQSISDEL